MSEWLPKGDRVDEAAWQRMHRSVVGLIAFHVVGLAIFGGATGHSFLHATADVFPIALLGSMSLCRRWGRNFQAVLGTLGLLTSSAVLVHFAHGATEAHFHFFVMVIVVTRYQAWLPFVVAIGFVLVHHTVAGVLAPSSVFDHAEAARRPWLWATVHAAFVLAAAVACLRFWKHAEDEMRLARRAAAAEREQELRLIGAIRINDTIVQGLVAARFAADTGEVGEARHLLSVSLARAQSLVTELMKGADGLAVPGSLRRYALAGEEP